MIVYSLIIRSDNVKSLIVQKSSKIQHMPKGIFSKVVLLIAQRLYSGKSHKQ